jgi:hypothetical protein
MTLIPSQHIVGMDPYDSLLPPVPRADPDPLPGETDDLTGDPLDAPGRHNGMPWRVEPDYAFARFHRWVSRRPRYGPITRQRTHRFTGEGYT